MSSSNISSLQTAANSLNYAAMMFIRCYSFIALPLGTLGHLLSIYVFTRRVLQSNACSRYFLAATIVGLIDTLYVLPMRIIQSGFTDIDPGAHSLIFCKITWFLLNAIRVLCSWLIVLASIDRFVCSSASTNIRALSNIRIANRIIPITIFFGSIAYIHVAIFFDIGILLTTQKPICYPLAPPGTYRIFLSFFNLFYFGLLPPFCMFLFGLLTIKNLERSKRIFSQNSVITETTVNRNNRKTNRQMHRMLFCQVLVYCVTGVAFSIGMIVTSMNPSAKKNVYELAQDNMINAVVGMLSNFGPNFSFYIFTLSSGLFRKELKNLFHIHHQNASQIHVAMKTCGSTNNYHENTLVATVTLQ